MRRQDIDKLCDEFESRWLSDNSLVIEDFLNDQSTSAHDKLIDELIIQEVDLRFSAGFSPLRSRYEQRFPKNLGAIARAFHRLETGSHPLLSQVLTVSGTNNNNNNTLLGSVKETKIPEQLGSFQILNRIGSGSFGIVFRAKNLSTGKTVAIKFPKNKTLNSVEEFRQFCREAELAQSLDHPAIVESLGLHDEDGFLFIVQEYVEGTTLRRLIDQFRDPEKAVKLVATLADAIAYAHRNGLVHRDLKPSNVLIDQSENPHIADFGLSVHESFQRRLRGQRSGTPAYMSPEQVMGLTHQLDGRSDIWSLGVILYELLTNQRPFGGGTVEELFEEVKLRNEKPLRMLRPDLDQELQRICLKCLSKSIRDRYPSADELADDLNNWLGFRDQWQSKSYVPLVPRGLRPFGPDDAEAFVELLPGPRNQHGVPESIQFWKMKLESLDAELRCPIGVIFGPSGSGKSSFVRAGLIPRLDPKIVTVIYVEATAFDTEIRLIKALRTKFEGIPEEISLPKILDGIRNGMWSNGNSRTLIILDQFEQWVHRQNHFESPQLVQALRHCDGANLMCIVTIRDEYWLSMSRLLDDLAIDLQERQNAQRIDRFDKDHALKVLFLIGRALKKLPGEREQLSKQQNSFLEQVVDDLAEENRVASVHLTLFAEMFRNREWSIKELTKLGGVSAVGTKFLEETFDYGSSSPVYLEVECEARIILEMLLPDSGIDLKGHMQPVEPLRNAVEQQTDSTKFDRAIEVLDQQLRMIVQTEPNRTKFEHEDAVDAADLNYQLTHDYLVPSIRDWVQRKKKSTWRGRARLQFENQYNVWKSNRESRNLLSPSEYLGATMAIRSSSLDERQAEFLRLTRNKHLVAISGIAVAATLLVFLINGLLSQNRKDSAYANLDLYYEKEPEFIDPILEEIVANSRWLEPIIEQRAESSTGRDRLRSTLALSQINKSSPDHLRALLTQFAEYDDQRESKAILRSLNSKKRVVAEIEKLILGENITTSSRLKLISAALLFGDSSRAKSLFLNRKDPTEATLLVSEIWQTWPNYSGLADLCRSSDNDVVFCALSAMSLVSIESINNKQKTEWKNLVFELMKNRDDSGVYSMCELLSRNWNQNIPDELLDSCADSPKESSDMWNVSLSGERIRFVRIPIAEFSRGAGAYNPVTPHQKEYFPIETAKTNREIWLASTELSFRQALAWLNLPENADLRKLLIERNRKLDDVQFDLDLPLDFISLEDANRLVNWLNQQSLLSEDYEFCLPFPDEWELACRGECVTSNYWGESDALKYNYAAIAKTVDAQDLTLPKASKPIGSLIPNRRGLFDMIGNVCEHTPKGPRELAINSKPLSFFRGGKAVEPRQCKTSFYMGIPPNGDGEYYGMRLAISKK